MLTIRKAQMQAFDAYLRQSFEDRMVRHIARSFPEQFKTLTDPEFGDKKVRALICRGIERAGRYRIEVERDVARFIDLMVKIDPSFDTLEQMQWANAILRDETISGHGKIELIYRQLPTRLTETESASDRAASH